MRELQQSILNGIREIRQSSISNQLWFENQEASGANEFLFFIKPELLLEDPNIQLEAILDLILGKILSFGFEIKTVRGLSASYLEKHSIIASHYGVINQIASNAKGKLSSTAITRFQELFGISVDEADVLGGLEMLQRYPNLNAEALDYIWQNIPFQKLAGGSYALRMTIDGQPLFLVNGFHPRQLEHFIKPGRGIVAFTLTGDLDWRQARQAFIGQTVPASADEGSIRSELHQRYSELGLKAITPSWNGVHLSAGPVEALAELMRYQSDLDADQKCELEDFSFGRQLLDTFDKKQVLRFLDNPNLRYLGKTISVFDLTEEQNADKAIDMLLSAEI